MEGVRVGKGWGREWEEGQRDGEKERGGGWENDGEWRDINNV